MTGNIAHLLILTLNINGLKAPIKGHRIANWVKKIPNHMLLTKRHISLRKKKKPTGLGWKKVFQANGPYKQAGVAILISDKVDFLRLKSVRSNNKGHFILIKGTVHQKEVSICVCV
jgi:exonuclease III